MDRRGRQINDSRFDTFDPKAAYTDINDDEHYWHGRDESIDGQGQMEDSDAGDGRSDIRNKSQNKSQYPSSKITEKDKSVLDLNYRAMQGKYEKLRKNAFLDVMNKVNHFKLSGSSRVRISEFMNRKSREDKLMYPFGIERDPLIMKVLIQILYDELDKSMRACCTGLTPASKAKADQSMLDDMAAAVAQIRDEEKNKYESQISDLMGEVHLHKRQLKRKNWLISRLFTDKSLFSKYWDDFSLLFVDVFRLLQQSEEIKDPDLLDRIAKANEFVIWAKDYNDDERRYVADQDWTNIKEREKKSLMDDVDLSKRKVWDYKRAKHIERVSANEISLNQRLSRMENKHSKSVDSETNYQDAPNLIKVQSRGQQGSLKDKKLAGLEGKTSDLIQPASFEEFASSFNNLTYDQLQDFCLALSDQLAQVKKDLTNLKEKSDLESQERKNKDNKLQKLQIEEREKSLQKVTDLVLERTEISRNLEQSKKELERMKVGLTEASIMVFDCYNVVVNIGKNATYLQPFGRFLSESNSLIMQQYMKARSLLSKVYLIDLDNEHQRSERGVTMDDIYLE